ISDMLSPPASISRATVAIYQQSAPCSTTRQRGWRRPPVPFDVCVLTLPAQPGIKHRFSDQLAGGVVVQLRRLAGKDAHDIPALRVRQRSHNVPGGGSKYSSRLCWGQRLPRIRGKEGAVAGQQGASDEVLRCSLIKITLPGAYGSTEVRRLLTVAQAHTR